MSSFIGNPRRRAVVFSIVILIAVVHIIRIGSYLQGELFSLYNGYFSDSVLPFGCYFPLCESELQMPILKHWEANLAIAFLKPSIAETCQYLGIPVLGSTFDLLDPFMYRIGAVSVVVVDTQVFSRIFGFGIREKAERQCHFSVFKSGE